MLRFALFTSLLAVSLSSAEPLVKPVVPGKTFTRVEFPLQGGKGKAFHFAGTVPTLKSIKGSGSSGGGPGVAEIRVGLCTTLPMASVKTLQSWGYEVTAGQRFTIPSIMLIGETIVKGKREVAEVKLTSLVVNVFRNTYGSEDKALGADVLLTPDQLHLASAGQSEFWMTFDENATAQISYPAKQVKTTGSMLEDRPAVAEAKVDPEWLPVRIPLQPSNYFFDMKVLNGISSVGKSKNCSLEIAFTNKDYVYITRPMAVEYGIKLGDDAPMTFGGDTRNMSAAGVASNIRLVAASGAGWKNPIDMEYKEVKLTIGLEPEQPSMCLTPGYLSPRIQSMLLAVGTDGIPRLHGYTEKGFTADPKKVEAKKVEAKKK